MKSNVNRVNLGHTEYQLLRLLTYAQRLVYFLPPVLSLVPFALRLTLPLVFRNFFPSILVEE